METADDSNIDKELFGSVISTRGGGSDEDEEDDDNDDDEDDDEDEEDDEKHARMQEMVTAKKKKVGFQDAVATESRTESEFNITKQYGIL